MNNNTRGYWTEICSGIPMKEWTISKDFYDLISSRVPRTCSYTVFMQFMKFNRGTMDLQKWMTRFQLTGNRLIESWMDLLPEPSETNPEAIQLVQQKRQEHERDQTEKALAAATPGAAPHVVIPWSDELALVAFRQYKEQCRQLQRQAFPLGENLLALIFVSLADLTQDQRNTLTSIMAGPRFSGSNSVMSHQSSIASSKAKKLVLPSYAGATFVVICCVMWICVCWGALLIA